MPWIRLDDQFPDHPKVLAAGPAAAWLYVCGIGYCNRLLTDGLIPAGQVRKLADVDDAKELAARLVAVGLWEEVDEGYRIHDFLDYQPSAEQVKAERIDNAKRQQEWRDRNKGRNGVSNTVTAPVSNAPRNGTVTDAPYPPRTRTQSRTKTNENQANPVAGGVPLAAQPLADAPSPAPKSRAKRGTPAPDEFPISDEMREWADYHAPGVDLDRETLRFLNRARSKNETYANWRAAWENWMTNPIAKQTVASAARAPNGVYDLTTRRPSKNDESLSAIGNFTPPEARRHP